MAPENPEESGDLRRITAEISQDRIALMVGPRRELQQRLPVPRSLLLAKDTDN